MCDLYVTNFIDIFVQMTHPPPSSLCPTGTTIFIISDRDHHLPRLSLLFMLSAPSFSLLAAPKFHFGNSYYTLLKWFHFTPYYQIYQIHTYICMFLNVAMFFPLSFGMCLNLSCKLQ